MRQLSQYNEFRALRSDIGSKKIILFHAASSGEYEQVLPIARQIDRGSFYVIVSVFSPTIYRAARESQEVDYVCFHPFDFIFSAIIFFKTIMPELYIINRHDIWPAHVYIAQRLGIDIYLVNGNIHKSLRFHWFLQSFNRWLFRKFTHVFVESGVIKDRFSNLVSEDKISVTGDTRYEQIIHRTKNNRLDHFSSDIKRTTNIIFGSIVPSDIEIIISSLASLYPRGSRSLKEKNHRLIFVPHEVSDGIVQILESFLMSNSFTPSYYQGEVNNFIGDSVIVKKVGILPELYSYTGFAYVGGGFARGVHNVLEPAIYGNIVCHGPNYALLNDAEKMVEKEISIAVSSDSELTKAISLLDMDSERAARSRQTKEYAMKDIYPSQDIINMVLGSG